MTMLASSSSSGGISILLLKDICCVVRTNNAAAGGHGTFVCTRPAEEVAAGKVAASGVVASKGAAIAFASCKKASEVAVGTVAADLLTHLAEQCEVSKKLVFRDFSEFDDQLPDLDCVGVVLFDGGVDCGDTPFCVPRCAGAFAHVSP